MTRTYLIIEILEERKKEKYLIRNSKNKNPGVYSVFFFVVLRNQIM